MIVLNEIKYAEEILKTGKIDKKPSATISLLAKYYRQYKNKSENETIEIINEFMDKYYPFFNKVKWQNSIVGIVSKATQYKLREIENISISKNELNKIKELKNERLERLLFTMLCFAKTYNMTSEINNGWVNTDINEIYNTARVSVKQADEKHFIIHKLIQDGYLECSKKNTNLNLRITFIDNSSDCILNINNLEELGYEYMQYINKGRFCRCENCGKLIKLKNTERSKKYCKECATQVNREKTKNRMFDLRHSNFEDILE